MRCLTSRVHSNKHQCDVHVHVSILSHISVVTCEIRPVRYFPEDKQQHLEVITATSTILSSVVAEEPPYLYFSNQNYLVYHTICYVLTYVYI